MLKPEQIQQNWTSFRTYAESVADRKEQIVDLLDKFEDRLALCPASSKEKYHCAYPGGLVKHSLNVLVQAIKIAKIIDPNVSRESLVIACLFHDLGKIGDCQDEYYVPQTSEWHQKKGEAYAINPKIRFMAIPQRSLFLLQSFGIQLTQDEYLAILLHDGYVMQENKPYCMYEPKLATIVMMADYAATVIEKNEVPQGE